MAVASTYFSKQCCYKEASVKGKLFWTPDGPTKCVIHTLKQKVHTFELCEQDLIAPVSAINLTMWFIFNCIIAEPKIYTLRAQCGSRANVK